MATGTRLYVGNLSYNTDERSLREVFEQGGRKVAEIKLVTDRETGQPRGFAFVEMASPSDAAAAMAQWNGKELDGRTLKVNEAQERSGGGGRGGCRGGVRRGGGGGGVVADGTSRLRPGDAATPVRCWQYRDLHL